MVYWWDFFFSPDTSDPTQGLKYVWGIEYKTQDWDEVTFFYKNDRKISKEPKWNETLCKMLIFLKAVLKYFQKHMYMCLRI
jgi:hypothetical protein